jgi:hypothetical protein
LAFGLSIHPTGFGEFASELVALPAELGDLPDWLGDLAFGLPIVPARDPESSDDGTRLPSSVLASLPYTGLTCFGELPSGLVDFPAWLGELAFGLSIHPPGFGEFASELVALPAELGDLPDWLGDLAFGLPIVPARDPELPCRGGSDGD